jgi:hypothetical protein
MSARVWGLVLLVVALAAGGWYGYQQWQSTLRPAPAPLATTTQPATAPAEPAIQHPLPEAPAENEPAVTQQALRDELYRLADRRTLDSLLHMDDFVRRSVATVDNLPRETVALQVRAFKGVPGQLRVTGPEDALVLDASNYRRYTPLVSLFDSLDARQATSVFIRFYPLFQAQYRELGYPNRYFNDRVVAAIDDLLTAPAPSGPVRLVQPEVLYRFADPDLEGLSAGQKLMIRMGPDNAARVKAKLRLVRRELTSQAPAQAQGR